MTWEAIVHQVFWLCVDALKQTGDFIGMSYEEINIWLFVIGMPGLIVGLTLALIWQAHAYRAKVKNLARGYPHTAGWHRL